MDYETIIRAKPKVRYPRPVKFEIILGICTFSFYFCFWMFHCARDVKRIRENKFSPWLWFFAPLIPISVPIAFPRLFAELQAVEGKEFNRSWYIWGWMWIVALTASLFFIGFSDRGIITKWLSNETILLIIVFLTVFNVYLFSLLHTRINRIKKRDEKQLEFYGRKVWFNWWEWMLAIVGFIFIAFVVFFTWSDHASVIQKLPTNYTYTDQEASFQLTIKGKGWRQVNQGTNSDGSALVEFNDSDNSSFILVFEYTDDIKLDDIIDFRYGEVEATFNSVKDCSETRTLNEDKTSMQSLFYCQSPSNNKEKNLVISKLFKIDGKYYEILGQSDSALLVLLLNSDRIKSFNDNKETISNTIKSFRSLTKESVQK